MFVTWDLRSVTIYKDLFIQRVEILEDNYNKKVLEDTVAHIFVRVSNRNGIIRFQLKYS
jgi:hypothetical protein